MTRHGPSVLHLAMPISRETMLLMLNGVGTAMNPPKDAPTGHRTPAGRHLQNWNRPKYFAPHGGVPEPDCTRI